MVYLACGSVDHLVESAKPTQLQAKWNSSQFYACFVDQCFYDQCGPARALYWKLLRYYKIPLGPYTMAQELLHCDFITDLFGSLFLVWDDLVLFLLFVRRQRSCFVALQSQIFVSVWFLSRSLPWSCFSRWANSNISWIWNRSSQ